MPLRELTAGHNGGIFNGPKFSRLYTSDPEYGVPFLGSTDMLEADFTNMPLLHKKVARQLPYLEDQARHDDDYLLGHHWPNRICTLRHGWILVFTAHDEGKSRPS